MTIQHFVQAIKYANDFTIGHSGITKDGHLVTTLNCVKHQIKKGNLVIHFNGNWKLEKIANGFEMKQSKPTSAIICKPL